MTKYTVISYTRDRRDTPITIDAEDAAAAIRMHDFYRSYGEMTFRLGGPEFQAHWQGDARSGRSGIEAIHAFLTPEKVNELDAVRVHDERRKLAFDLIHDGRS